MSDATLVFESEFTDIYPGEIVLIEANGREAMSQLYEYELTLEVTSDGGLAAGSIDGLLANPCRIIMTDTNSVEVHGMLRHIRLEAANEARPVVYQATLVPQLWKTTLGYRTRVFQDVDVRGIIDAVLVDYGLTAEWWLTESYPTNEYVVQYEESDLAFFNRQLEHWGIYYFFRQEADGEVLVIADHDRAFAELEGFDTLTFNPRSGRSGVSGSVHHISHDVSSQPAFVTVREYNWRTPSTPLLEQHVVDENLRTGLQWYYGEHFKDATEGQMIARIRSEQLLNNRELYEGTMSVPGLAPGHKFTLSGCPISDLDITYLITSVEPTIAVTGDYADEAYQYRFTARPLERDEPAVTAYRSQRSTPKPQIRGFMNGIVDGEVPGTAAPLDELGRYKIVLPMDTVAVAGEGKASRWIRMSQASAGANYGIHFPLHIGTEVAIIHVDGDPDRPVIMGSIPNAETVSPVVNENATQSQIKTSTGILVEFDDDVV